MEIMNHQPFDAAIQYTIDNNFSAMPSSKEPTCATAVVLDIRDVGFNKIYLGTIRTDILRSQPEEVTYFIGQDCGLWNS